MQSPPSLSVIITQFRRTRFLPFALDSLSNQTLGPCEFEVVIVADAPPAKELIDAYSFRIRWQVIDPAARVGQAIRRGIECSEGSILCFLDDDDAFLPTRLEVIKMAFSAHAKLGYYHNSQTLMGPDGLPARKSIRAIGIPKPPKVQGQVLFPGEGVSPKLKLLKSMSADFNMSSIAIRRSVVEPHLNALDRLGSCQDSFLFFAALSSGLDILLDTTRLTLYRVSGALTSDERDGRKSVYSRSWRYGQWIEDLTRLRAYFHDASTASVVRAVDTDLCVPRVLELVTSGIQERRPEAARALFSLVQGRPGVPRLTQRLVLIVLVSGFLIAPRLAQLASSILEAH